MSIDIHAKAAEQAANILRWHMRAGDPDWITWRAGLAANAVASHQSFVRVLGRAVADARRNQVDLGFDAPLDERLDAASEYHDLLDIAEQLDLTFPVRAIADSMISSGKAAA